MSIFKLSNSTFDNLRRVVEYWIPGLGTFYITIATIWDLPFGEQIVGTLAAMALLLATIIGINRKKHDPSTGEIVVSTADPEKDLYSLEMGVPLETLQDKELVTLRVLRPGSQ